MSSKKPKKEHKKMSFKRFLLSFKYSWDGLKYAYTNEQSLRMHAIGSILIIIIGILLHVSFIEWLALIISSVMVLVIELLNTAIEHTVDLVTKEIHPLAKVAKDCGSAAGGIAGITMAIVALAIFIPKVIALFK